MSVKQFSTTKPVLECWRNNKFYWDNTWIREEKKSNIINNARQPSSKVKKKTISTNFV